MKMKNLIQCIDERKPVVVWNPYKINDSLSRDEFIVLTKLRGYTKVVADGKFLTAYQPCITVFGYETLEDHLLIAEEKQLNILATILQDELEMVDHNSHLPLPVVLLR
jgi:hypothetical protein